MRIASVGTAFPANRYPQAVITEALKERVRDNPSIPGVMDRLHSNCGVDFRNIMFPLESLGTRSGFGPNNDLWIKGAVDLGQQSIEIALHHAGLAPSDISAIFFTSHTGIACPSIDARLANRMGFPRDVKRTPIFGLGCVGGAAGVSRPLIMCVRTPKNMRFCSQSNSVHSIGRRTTTPSLISSPADSSVTAQQPWFWLERRHRMPADPPAFRILVHASSLRAPRFIPTRSI